MERELGRGGMAVVDLAQDLVLHQARRPSTADLAAVGGIASAQPMT